jgi:hypothetical protein
MSLAFTVVAIVIVVTFILGVVGFVIDRSADRHERRGGR